MNDNEFINIFLEESKGWFLQIESGLRDLENDCSDMDKVNEIFRAYHNIKGVAASLELEQIKSIAHVTEDLFSKVRNKELEISKDLISVTVSALDSLVALHENLSDFGSEGDEDLYSSVVQEINVFTSSHTDSITENVPIVAEISEKNSESSGGFTSFDNDDYKEQEFKQKDSSSQNSASETTSDDRKKTADKEPLTQKKIPKPIQSTAAKPTPSAKSNATPPRKSTDSLLQIKSSLIEDTLETMGELNLIKNKFQSLKSRVQGDAQLLGAIRDLQFVTEEMQRQVSKLRLSTLTETFENMHRVVRLASKETGKRVKLNASGHETLLDRKILAILKEPLVHMVRNSVDHGIEDPDYRATVRKDPEGSISLKAFYRSGEVQIILTDDGAGIDVDRVKSIAVKNGIIDQRTADTMEDNDVYHLIFEAGFSTKEKVTGLSGRGVGMDIVKTAIAKIRGSIEILSEKNVGTTMVLKLPLNLSIIESLYIQIGDERYTIPQNSVIEVFPANSKSIVGNISDKQGVGSLLHIRGTHIPVISMNSYLKLPKPNHAEYIIVRNNGQKFVLELDRVLTPATVFVQNIDKAMKIKGPYSGVSKYVDGSPVLQLDLPIIAKSIHGFSKKTHGSESLSRNVQIELTQSDIKRLHQKIISFHNGEHFGIPIQRIENIFYIKKEDIHVIGENGHSYVTENENTITLLWVEELLKISQRSNQDIYWVAQFHIDNDLYGIVMNDFSGIIPMSLNYKLLNYDSAILGSTVENGKTHIILDTHALAIKSKGASKRINQEQNHTSFELRCPTVLIVEDEPFFRSQLSTYLENYGIKTVIAVDGLDAHDILLNDPDKHYTAAIVDIEMPRMDGISLISWMGSHPTIKRIPKFMLSAITTKSMKRRARLAGALAYISKFDYHRVLDIITSIHAGSTENFWSEDPSEKSQRDLDTKIVTFRFNNHIFALPMNKIIEVSPEPNLTQVRNETRLLRGISQFKGKTIINCNLSLFLDPGASYDETRLMRVIVQFEESVISFFIKTIGKAHNIADLEVQHGLAQEQDSKNNIVQHFISSVFKCGDELIYLLSTERLEEFISNGYELRLTSGDVA